MRPIYFSGLLLIIISCANPQYPNGGPTDTIPPTILTSSIPSGTTQFSKKEIWIEFSEYMNKATVQSALFLSPVALNSYELKWSGTKLNILFKSDLKKEITYVLTIGSGASDLRAGNKMEKSWKLAFSTGAEIDSGMIKGVVKFPEGKPAQGVSIFAYQLLSNSIPDPEKDEPDYITQTGSDGTFNLLYMKELNYRIFAVQDIIKNNRYDMDVEPIGLGQDSIISATINPTEIQHIYMGKPDISPPTLTGLVMESPYLMKLTFSKPLVKMPDLNLLFNNERINSSSLISSINKSEQWWAVIDSLPDGEHGIVSNHLTDERGNMSKPDTFFFSYLYETKDLKKLSWVFPSDSSQILTIQQPIHVLFKTSSKIDSVKLSVKLKKEGSLVRPFEVISINKINDHYIQIRPNISWPMNHQIRGWAFSGKDTITIAFRTEDPDQTGEISGKLSQWNSSLGLPFIELRLVGSNLKPYIFHVKNEAFNLKQIPAGKYVITGFLDENNNSLWDYGQVQPWKKPEIRFTLPDTLRVRARWSIEEIEIPVR